MLIKEKTNRGNGNCLSSGKKPQLSREQLKADQQRVRQSLERGGGPCGDGRACNMFRRVCLETGGLGQSAAREEDRAKHS
ncbi:uncharacterized [Tachysurus ichikawai]